MKILMIIMNKIMKVNYGNTNATTIKSIKI